MFNIVYVLLTLSKVLTVFFFLYVFIPANVIGFEENSKTVLDKVYIGLSRMAFSVIVIIHSLVFLHLYDTFSLIIMLSFLYVYLAWLKNKSFHDVSDALGMKFVAKYLEIVDIRNNFLHEFFIRLYKVIKLKAGVVRSNLIRISMMPFEGLLPAVVFGVTIFIRFKYSIEHFNYTNTDPYFHMAWAKFMDNNQIYHDGIYSYGYHSLLSAINRLFFIDYYWLMRFIGPLGGTLLAISVFYFIYKTTGDRIAATVSLAFIGIINDNRFPSALDRQTSALPQEFGGIFILPAMYFLWEFINGKNKHYMLLFIQTMAVSFLIHPFSTAYMIIWSSVLTVFSLVFGLMKIKEFVEFIRPGVIYGGIAVLPFVIGLASGKSFFKDSARFIQENLGGKTGGFKIEGVLASLYSGNIFFIGSTVIGAALIIVSFIYLRINTEYKSSLVLNISIVVTSIIMLMLFRADELGIPSITEAGRTGVFLCIILSCLAGVFYFQLKNLLNLLITKKTYYLEYMPKIFALLICFIIIFNNSPGKLSGNSFTLLEYDEAAENYLKIRHDNAMLEWTIVAPTEQYQQALNYGWHYELLRFVQNYTPQEVSKKEFQFNIPTPHIYVYVEKIPFKFDKPITEEDAKKELEREGDDPFRQYYHTPGQRAIIEAKALVLMETYRKTHENTSIYFENENLRIYYLDNKDYYDEVVNK